MGNLFIILAAILLIAEGKGNVILWIIGGIIVVAILGSLIGKPNQGTRRETPTRIDHPHIWADDDSECSVCGARFERKQMVCPNCGTRFEETTEDYEEFDEEEDEMEDMDEEDGW